MTYKLVSQKDSIPLPDVIVRGDTNTRESNTHKFKTLSTNYTFYQKVYMRAIVLWNM